MFHDPRASCKAAKSQVSDMPVSVAGWAGRVSEACLDQFAVL